MDTTVQRDNQRRSEDAMGRAGELGSPRAPARSPQANGSASAEPFSTIREMARDFGVSVRTLRFYEDRGLLHPKRDGATRLYDARQRRNVKLILKGKQLGFTLTEINDMLRSQDEALAALRKDDRSVAEFDLDDNLELALPPEQIVAQIGYLERQRRELDAAIVALRNAHRRLLESPCRAAIA